MGYSVINANTVNTVKTVAANTSSDIVSGVNAATNAASSYLKSNTTSNSSNNNTASNANPTSMPVSTNSSPGGYTTASGSINNSPNTNQFLEVGTPPFYLTPNSLTGAAMIPGQTELSLIQYGLVNVDFIPMLPDFELSFNLFKLRPATSSDNPPRKMRVWTNPRELAVSESFSNNLTDSFLQSLIQRMEPIGQFAQMFSNESGVTGTMLSMMKNMAGASMNAIPLVGPTLSQGASILIGGRRVLFPKIWSDSGLMMSYTLPIYLICTDPGNDVLYKETILDPLELILKYVLPRSSMSKDSAVYEWPFFVYAESPGLFFLPEAMITNVQIDKNYSDAISFLNRPNQLKIEITITNIREVMPQKNGATIPSVALNLDTYMSNLQSKKFSPIVLEESNAPPINLKLPSIGSAAANGSPASTSDAKQILNKIPKPISNVIQEQACANNMDPDMVKAIMWQESSANPNATGNTNPPGYGYMQITPDTSGTIQSISQAAMAKGYSNFTTTNLNNPAFLYNPANNIVAGTTLLSQKRNSWGINTPGSNMSEETTQVLSMYNSGVPNPSNDPYASEVESKFIALKKAQGMSSSQAQSAYNNAFNYTCPNS
jgi:soluble lytic murein transglycosylase-like protein